MSKINNTIENYYAQISKLKINSVERKNGDFEFASRLKEFVLNDYFKQQDNLWNFISESSDNFAEVLYEGVANMLENISDIDMCTIDQLKNLASMLNIDDLSIFEIPYTDKIKHLIDTYSVNKEYVLYGRHSLTDLQEIFGIDERLLSDEYEALSDEDKELYDAKILAEQAAINDAYLSTLVDESFKEVIVNMLYDPTSKDAIEHIALLEIIVPVEHLQADYTYVSGVRDGTVDRLPDPDHYDFLMSNVENTMIVTASRFLRNFCIKILMLRETLKSIAQKNSIIGTQKIIEKLITEFVIKEYSNVEELGFYVPTKTEEQILEKGVNNDPFKAWSKLLNGISDLGSLLEIEVVEYYDTTEYMNIAPSAIPFRTETTPITEWYEEPYLNASGAIEYLPGVYRTIGYEEVPTTDLARGAGNTRYWEEALSNENDEEILSLFRRLGVITEDDNIDVLMQFLDRLYDIHSPDFWTSLSATDYVSEEQLAVMQTKYSGASGDDPTAPHMNIKSQDYATIAPLPFIWNLIEKTYETFPKLIQYSIDSMTKAGEDYTNIIDVAVGGDKGHLYNPSGNSVRGMIVDSWRSYAKEFMGYSSFFEDENNLDDIDEENKNVQIDGSFNMLALGDLLSMYDDPSWPASGEYYTAASGILSGLSEYYENIG